MKRLLVILLAIAATGLFSGGCDRRPAKPAESSKAPAQTLKKEWTAEDIRDDPQGYLSWSDQQVAAQIAQNQRELDALANRRKELEGKRTMLAENIADVENLHRRLSQAYERAEDEDRWPIKIMNGRTFTREQAQGKLEQYKKYVDDRRPLDQTYDQLFAKMDDTAKSLRGNIARLTELREKIALDLEQVRLNKSIQDIDKLRTNEAQLAAMSKAVATLSDDTTRLVAPKEPPGRVSIDELLK